MISQGRSLVWLTAAILRRLVREGMVMRSLLFPTAIVVGTLLITLAVASVVRGNSRVALTPDVWQQTELVGQIQDMGLEPYESTTLVEDIEEWRAWAGFDGKTMYIQGSAADGARLEAMLRTRAGADWIPEPIYNRPTGAQAARQGRFVLQGMALLFALYGVVFGAGMVVRDRSEGTLEAEFSLPVPHWYHGAARWLAGTIGLSLFLVFGLALLHATLGLSDPGAMLRHGLAANAAATAIGMFAAARAGRDTGFSGPFTFGISAVTGLVTLSVVFPEAAVWIPLASIATAGTGWPPLFTAGLCAVVAIASFAYMVDA